MSRRWRVVQHTLVMVSLLGVPGVARTGEAQEPLLNCNQVERWDRCDCNLRVLRAINRLRVTVSDPVQSPNPTPPRVQEAVLHERLRRWRTFVAPNCGEASTGDRLPVFNEHVPAPDGISSGRRLQPLGTRPFAFSNTDVHPERLLVGRWEGWRTLPDGKPTPIFFHVAAVSKYFVRACSSHGMVFGVLRGDFPETFLELPGPESSGLAYTFRLWRSGPPTFRDLEGVALLDLRPNEELVAGQVWLTRAQKLESSPMPTKYFCEDREHEDWRTGTKPPEMDSGDGADR